MVMMIMISGQTTDRTGRSVLRQSAMSQLDQKGGGKIFSYGAEPSPQLSSKRPIGLSLLSQSPRSREQKSRIDSVSALARFVLGLIEGEALALLVAN